MKVNVKIEHKLGELAAALAESDEFERFQAAKEELENHTAAQVMLRDFAERQRELQARAAKGEQPTEEEMRQFEQQAQAVSLNPYLRPFLESEYALSQLVAEVHAQLLVGLGLASPEQLADEGDEDEHVDGSRTGEPSDEAAAHPSSERNSGGQPSAKSQLWTPGSGIDPGIPNL